MTAVAGKPEPDRHRFARVELQQAYEHGFAQEHDHDSFVPLERFAWLLEDADSAVLGAERIAAMLDGAADALHALAQSRRDDIPLLRTLIDGAGCALAVMADDTVLCADCLDELRAEQACDTTATAVYAWLADPAGHACRCCGATDNEAGS
jgi:hypothetical protein